MTTGIWLVATIVVVLAVLVWISVGRWTRAAGAVSAWFVLTAILFINIGTPGQTSRRTPDRLADQAGPFLSGLVLVVLVGAAGVLTLHILHLIGRRVRRTGQRPAPEDSP
jgi:hypothetical protein